MLETRNYVQMRMVIKLMNDESEYNKYIEKWQSKVKLMTSCVSIFLRSQGIAPGQTKKLFEEVETVLQQEHDNLRLDYYAEMETRSASVQPRREIWNHIIGAMVSITLKMFLDQAQESGQSIFSLPIFGMIKSVLSMILPTGLLPRGSGIVLQALDKATSLPSSSSSSSSSSSQQPSSAASFAQQSSSSFVGGGGGGGGQQPTPFHRFHQHQQQQFAPLSTNFQPSLGLLASSSSSTIWYQQQQQQQQQWGGPSSSSLTSSLIAPSPLRNNPKRPVWPLPPLPSYVHIRAPLRSNPLPSNPSPLLASPFSLPPTIATPTSSAEDHSSSSSNNNNCHNTSSSSTRQTPTAAAEMGGGELLLGKEERETETETDPMGDLVLQL